MINKKQKKSIFLYVVFGVSCIVSLAPKAYASGFALREGEADWMGNAFAGDEAKAYDAGTVWTNPAGMALLNQAQFSGNISYIGPSARFSGYNTDPLTRGNVSGARHDSLEAPAATAALFAVFPLNPKWRVGVSLTTPYGARTSYPKNWVGRYQCLVTSITSVDLSTAFSYKFNNHFSVGFGPVFEYFNPRLTQALNIPYTNTVADMHGDDIGFGYNIGFLYRINEGTRIGIDYHSRIRHDISGVQRVVSSYPLLNSATAARTTITTPDSINIGIYHFVTSRLAVMGSIKWTHWALFNSLHITPENGSQGTTIQANWRNSWLIGGGINYHVNNQLMLQTGFSFDESPVTSSTMNPRAPDANQYIFGLGVQYKVTPKTSFNLAYAHIFTPGGTINSTAMDASPAPSGTLIGSYSISENAVTAGVDVIF